MRLQICKDRNTAAGEVHPASSRSRLVENGRAQLHYATVETPFFFFFNFHNSFFFSIFFFLRLWGARGLGRLRYLFVCLLFFKFFKVRLRRVENTAVGENPAPNERRVLKED